MRFSSALEFDYDAHAVAIGFVADVGNVLNVFVVDQLRDALDEDGLVHLVGNFGDDDGLAIFVDVLDGGFGAHHEAATSGAVSLENSAAAVDDSGSRKIRALNKFQNFCELRVGIVDQRDGGVDDFRQIVRRNFRRHAYSDTVTAVDQQVRNARGKNVRFYFAAVVVGMEIDSLFIQIFQ